MARDPKRARVRLNVTSHHNKHKIKNPKKSKKNKKPKKVKKIKNPKKRVYKPKFRK